MSAISSVRAGVVVAIVTALALSTSCHRDHAPRGAIGAARPAEEPSAPRRGLYVADTPAVIATPDGGADLARFVHDHAISRVVLYGLGRLLGDAEIENGVADMDEGAFQGLLDSVCPLAPFCE